MVTVDDNFRSSDMLICHRLAESKGMAAVPPVPCSSAALSSGPTAEGGLSTTAKRLREPQERFRVMNHYFVAGDIVWIRPEKHPYWPAEVESVDEKANTATCILMSPPNALIERKSDESDNNDEPNAYTTAMKAEEQSAATAAVRVTMSVKKTFFFDHIEDGTELSALVESRLQRTVHDVSPYEAAFRQAVDEANNLVRIVLDPKLLKPFSVCGIGIVRSFMRRHTDAPRQPQTKEFAPQTAVIVLRPGLENAVRDLNGFERIWVLFHFSYSVGVHPDRAGNEHTTGWKTMIVPPRDSELRGVFATRSPHRPNSIGLSCVRLVRVQGLEVHIADHDLLHGTPVLDIKPYLPFCDSHPTAKAGWVEDLDARNAGGADHRSNNNMFVVHRNLVAPSSAAAASCPAPNGTDCTNKLTKHA